VCELVILLLFKRQVSNFSTIFWREQVTFQLGYILPAFFVLDQHAFKI